MNALTNSIALYALPLIGSILLAYGIYQAFFDLRKSDKRRITERLTEQGSQTSRKLPDSIIRRQNTPQTVISRAMSKLRFVTWLQRALDQGNMDWSATTVLTNVLGVTMFAGVGCYFMELGTWTTIGLCGMLLLLPLIVIHFKRKMRLNKMVNQLPDVFELLSQALRAGHSLSNAIQLVSQQLPDPAGTEFAIVFHEQNLGIKIEDALTNMADRLDQMDVRFFVTAVLIQRTTGGDLASVLDNISEVIRDRIKLFGTVKALTAEGRLSGYVLFALPFAVFGMEQVINPEYGSLLIDTQIGQYCLIGAFVAQLLGLAMIQKIVNIKV
jgi:tight adherence protein B